MKSLQLYIQGLGGQHYPPRERAEGLRAHPPEKGEKRVTLHHYPRIAEFYNYDIRYVCCEPGEFRVMIGPNLAAMLKDWRFELK